MSNLPPPSGPRVSGMDPPPRHWWEKVPAWIWALPLGIAGMVGFVFLAGEDDPYADEAELVEHLDMEVENGGFVQFFYNTRGKDNDATADALELLGRREQLSVFLGAALRFEAERRVFEAAWNDGSIAAFSRLYDETTVDDFDERWAY